MPVPATPLPPLLKPELLQGGKQRGWHKYEQFLPAQEREVHWCRQFSDVLRVDYSLTTKQYAHNSSTGNKTAVTCRTFTVAPLG
jgi:hypothetical protein